MNENIRKALEGSIKKWESIVKHNGVNKEYLLCKLCLNVGCGRCPVAKRTSREDCLDTPHVAWVYENDKDHCNNRGEGTPRLKQLAQLELDFLCSLRPKRKMGRK